MENKQFKVPHTYVILITIAIIAAILTWIIPAGQFDTVYDSELERTILVPGSFHHIEKTPVGFFKFFTLIQESMIESADIIFFIFFSYSFVHILMESGAFDSAIGALLKRLGNNQKFLIPIMMFLFGIGGSTFGMTEETYGLLPIFMGMTAALGYDSLVGGAMVVIGAGTGFASATFNPFTLGIAQTIAELPLLSGIGFRIIIFIVMQSVSIFYVMRYANKVKKHPDSSIVKDVDFKIINSKSQEELMKLDFLPQHKISILLFGISIILIVYGAIELDWYINEIAALFIIMSILVGKLNSFSFSEIADLFIDAARGVIFGAMSVGIARSILTIMTEGNIIDTAINSLAGLANTGNKYTSGIMMLIVQNILNFFIPSGSGQAAVSMPIMAPLSDMVGLNRQIAVLAFQFGDGYSNMLWPTSVSTECGIMGLPLNKWYKFFLPLAGIMFLLQIAFMIIAIAINYGPF